MSIIELAQSRQPYFLHMDASRATLLPARPAAVTWSGGVPPVDGLGLPAPGPAYERVGLGEPEVEQTPGRDPESLRHFRQ